MVALPRIISGSEYRDEIDGLKLMVRVILLQVE